VTFKTIEDVLRNSKFVDHTLFDELYSEDSPKAFYAINLLKSVEKLAKHLELLNDNDYQHRLVNYGQIDRFINEIPRAVADRYFSIRTFILSCRRLRASVDLKSDKCSVYQITKVYPKECSKLHLSFHNLLGHLQIMAKYWNKVRKAKRRTYEKLQQSEESGKFVTLNAQRNLFFDSNTNNANDKESYKDQKFLRFYDHSIEKLKGLIQNLSVTRFEK
jgi:hypothetical protein